MPEEKPTKKEKSVEATFAEIQPASTKTVPAVIEETILEPRTIEIAPDSPWKRIHSDSAITTFTMEVKGAGTILRTQTYGSESMVFLPNVLASQLPK